MMPLAPSPALLRSLRCSVGVSRACLRCCCGASDQYQLRRHVRRASSTAVSASKNIPPKLTKLYKALERLKQDASGHVDLSRLELALRSLEVPHPTIRIAFLGLNNFSFVRQLARLLLADPLEPLSQWEENLASPLWHDNRSLLLRYGDQAELASSSGILAIQHIPSRILEQNNVEILLSTMPVIEPTSENYPDPEDAALVPMIGTPTSHSGISLIRHPVHRAVVLADNLYGCIDLGQMRLASQSTSLTTNTSVKVVLNFAHEDFSLDASQQIRNLSIVDIGRAKNSLDLFRLSKDYGAEYAEGWSRSGLPILAEWLSETRTGQDNDLLLVVHELIDDLIRKCYFDKSSLIDSATKGQLMGPLHEAVKVWAMQSHEELRDALDEALSGKNWTKVQWFKLFWRADDVGMVLSQVLERSWLVQADRGLVWLEGRCAEAGLGSGGQTAAPANQTVPVEGESSLISSARRNLLAYTVPMMESLAQDLVVRTLSMTTVSSAIAVLIYVAWPAVTVLQASAFGALGLTLSLRRLQRTWESAKDSWTRELRDEGRKSLRNAEDSIKARIAKGPSVRDEDAQALIDFENARAAVDGVQRALDELRALKP